MNKLKFKTNHKKRIAEWVKFLKDDGDYDAGYALSILRYKFKRVREHIVEHNIVADAKKIEREIKVVEELLNRVINDEYDDKYHKVFEKKYGKSEWKRYPETKNTVRVEILYGGKPMTEKMGNEMRKNHTKAWNEKQADLKKAFDLMLKNIWNWWD